MRRQNYQIVSRFVSKWTSASVNTFAIKTQNWKWEEIETQIPKLFSVVARNLGMGNEKTALPRFRHVLRIPASTYCTSSTRQHVCRTDGCVSVWHVYLPNWRGRKICGWIPRHNSMSSILILHGHFLQSRPCFWPQNSGVVKTRKHSSQVTNPTLTLGRLAYRANRQATTHVESFLVFYLSPSVNSPFQPSWQLEHAVLF